MLSLDSIYQYFANKDSLQIEEHRLTLLSPGFLKSVKPTPHNSTI